MADTDIDDDPHAEGYDAFLAGKAIDANPYDPQDAPDMLNAWNEGWLEAGEDNG